MNIHLQFPEQILAFRKAPVDLLLNLLDLTAMIMPPRFSEPRRCLFSKKLQTCGVFSHKMLPATKVEIQYAQWRLIVLFPQNYRCCRANGLCFRKTTLVFCLCFPIGNKPCPPPQYTFRHQKLRSTCPLPLLCNPLRGYPLTCYYL